MTWNDNTEKRPEDPSEEKILKEIELLRELHEKDKDFEEYGKNSMRCDFYGIQRNPYEDTIHSQEPELDENWNQETEQLDRRISNDNDLELER